MGKKIKVIACSGHKFEVDTSDEACGKFGFKHGDPIIDNSIEKKGVVVGVARTAEWNNCGKETLWFAFDGNGVRVSYCEPFRKKNFILL